MAINFSETLRKIANRPSGCETTPKSETGKTLPYRGAAQGNHVPEPVRDGVSVSDAAKKMEEARPGEDNTGIYRQAAALARGLLGRDLREKENDIHELSALLNKMIGFLRRGGEDIIAATFEGAVGNEDYLASHSVNTCVYSIIMGLARGYDDESMEALALSALFHDVGMVYYMDLVNKPRRLVPAECEEIKQHTTKGFELLRLAGDILPKEAPYAALGHHERADGTGYPNGAESGAIDEITSIVGLADVYEAMSHSRGYRAGLAPYNAVKEIISCKSSYEYALLKILIERIGMFPPGSIVKLNNNRVAEVIKLNSQNPTRPVVRMLYDSDGRAIRRPELLDLASNFGTYILSGDC